jgi:alpha-1,2-mannosyltransferase
VTAVSTAPDRPTSGTAIETLERFVRKRPRTIIAVSLLGLIAQVWSLWAAHPPNLLDFQVYRWGVRTWLAGGDIMNAAPKVSDGTTLPWVYPPFALLPLSPFGLLPPLVGAALLHAVDLLALGATLYIVTRRVRPTASTLTALAVTAVGLPLALFSEPVRTSFDLGQINILLMALATLDCLARSRRRGVLVGLAMAIKLTPGVFLVLFLVRRDFRAAGTAVGTALLATLTGFLVCFRGSVDYWFRHGPASGVSGSRYYRNQSIMGGVARLNLPHWLAQAVWVLLCLALVVLVGYTLRRVEPPLAVVTTGVLGLLLSPTSWSDHWVWVAPGLLLMAAYAVGHRSKWWALLTAVTAVATGLGAFGLLPEQAKVHPVWTPLEQVLGNPYLLLGLALLVLLGARTLRRPLWIAQVGEDVRSESGRPCSASSISSRLRFLVSGSHRNR